MNALHIELDLTKSVFVRVETTYGRQRIYPACEISKKFIQFTGRKTFTEQDLELIKQLGYEVIRDTIIY